ncbi:MAG: VIT domain-containing protein, partial [Cyanobacteriota bacterium]|nr:VIT domain-containing protein [Cyanobacteriota bacterium]
MSIAKSTQPQSMAGLYADSSRGREILPLQHTAVVARISGHLCRVRVRQTFANSSDRSLEATYIFPLPSSAAVDRMQVRIGNRRIFGQIEKRETAYQIYQQAKQQGRTVGLLEQERDNVFAQSIAHIKPGERVEIELWYTELLGMEGGECEFVFPTVVGPRYIPGKAIAPGTLDTELVPDAVRICPPVRTDRPVVCHPLDIDLEIDGVLPIENLRSPSHDIEIERDGNRVRVRLRDGQTTACKDAIVRYQIANRQTQTAVLTQADDRGGHFALYGIPALTYTSEEIFPKDVVFLIDTSGSQMGDPLDKSKELMCRLIRGLNPDDTFTIINFADTAKQLSLTPLANTPIDCDRAIEYIQNLQAYGGTRMLGGIRAALEFAEPPPGRLRSIVMLTDGYIGNEAAILAEVQGKLQPGNRLHVFGVGSSVNRFLIEGLARVGRGISRVVRQDEPTEDVAESFFRQINNPVLRDIEVTWHGEGDSPEIYPAVVPDLFDRQPLTLFGRKADLRSGRLHITGITARGDRYERICDIDFDRGGNEAVAQLWGRSRIEHLTDRMLDYEKKSYVEEVTQTALSYKLLSGYTAFVAASQEVRVHNPENRISITIPVGLPEGLCYEGFIGISEAVAVLGGLRGSATVRPREACRSVRGRSKTPYPQPRLKPPPTLASDLSRKERTGNEEWGTGVRIDSSFNFPKCLLRELTPWERQLLEAIVEGTTNPDIAARLNRSIYQIERDICHLLHKTGTRSRAQLIREVCSQQRLMATGEIVSSMAISQIEISGLNDRATHQLARSLRSLGLGIATGGKMVFEAIVQNRRVLRVVWDDRASTLEDPNAIESIRTLLGRWSWAIDSGTIRIALRW